MPSLGPAEILVILVVALLVFGPNKMPEIARQVGRGFREFQPRPAAPEERAARRRLRVRLAVVDARRPAPIPVPMLPPKDDLAAADRRRGRRRRPGPAPVPRPRAEPSPNARPRHRLPSPVRRADPA